MNDSDNPRITTLEPRERPTAQQIIDELRQAVTAATASGVFERLLRCYHTRRCWRDGQSPDGRLTNDDAALPMFRWKGAPDLRMPLADKFVRWLAMLRMSVFNRGDARIGPRQAQEGMKSSEVAAVWQDTMDYFDAVQEWPMAKAYGLFSTCVEEFGHAFMLATWRKKQRTEKKLISIQQLTDHLMMMAEEALYAQASAELPEGEEFDPATMMTPEMQQALVIQVSAELQTMLAMASRPTAQQIEKMQAMDPRMAEAEAVAVLRALRARPAKPAEYYVAKDDGGVPMAEGLIPWVNCLYSHDLTVAEPGKSDFFAVPRFPSEARVRAQAAVEGWNKKAVDTLLKDHKNKFWDTITQGLKVPGWGMMGSGIGGEVDRMALEKVPRFLVVEVWRRVTNRYGMPRIIRAVINPHMTDVMLHYETTDLTELPIVCDAAEEVTYAIDARGVPDIVIDKQNFVIDTINSEGARGQLGSNPPLLRSAGQNVGVKPGIELYAKRSGQSYEGSKFMEVPVVDQGSLKVMELVEQALEKYYFRSTDTPPEDAKIFRESVMFASRRGLVLLRRKIWEQVQEHIENVQASMINGRDVQLNANRDQLAGEADISIGLHLDGFDKDGADKFIERMGKMIQSDRAGVIDWAEATNIMAQLAAPTYARRLVQTKEAASAKIIDDQEMRIAKMSAGVPVRYEERVSNPQLRKQVLEQWSQMPGNVERAQSDPLFAEMLNKEAEQLAFQEQQQVDNPMIGRTGVKPNAPTEN